MQIIEVAIDKLKEYENNPRNNEKAVEAVAESIKEFGFKVPVVIDTNYTIVAGHTRKKASELLGLETVPCIMANDLTPEKIKAYRLADNKTAELAEWDLEKLEKEMAELTAFDVDMSAFGFDDSLFDFDIDQQPATEEDDFDTEQALEEIEEPITQLGDIWQLGQHRLMCGDSTKEEDVKKLLNKEMIDMVFTDPPYGINLNGDNSARGSATSLMKGGLKLKSFKDDTIEYAIKAFNIVEKLNIQKQVWFGANYYCHSLPQTNNWLVWDKRVEEKMTNTNSDCELAWVLDGHNSCRIFRHLWNGLIKASENGEKRVHPTQKPIELVRWCKTKYAPEAQTILDLFGGSGSTLIACEKMNIKCYTMEIDTHYCDVIIKRWETLTGQEAVKVS